MKNLLKPQIKSCATNKVITCLLFLFFSLTGHSELRFVEEYLLYEEAPTTGSAEYWINSTFPFSIKLPSGMIEAYYLSEDRYSLFIYENNQAILINSEEIDYCQNWYEALKKSKSKDRNYWQIIHNGYYISRVFNLSLLMDQVEILNSNSEELDNIIFITRKKMGKVFDPSRKNAWFTRDGIKVFLYNILPENYDKFFDLTYNSLVVPPCNEKVDYRKGLYRPMIMSVGYYIDTDMKQETENTNANKNWDDEDENDEY